MVLNYPKTITQHHNQLKIADFDATMMIWGSKATVKVGTYK